MRRAVLSLFPGIDLLGRGFEAEGWQVYRGPDPIFGGDVRDFHVSPGLFVGVIAGPPCQDFSRARRSPPTGYGLEMLREFIRLAGQSQADWFVLENVPGCPSVVVPGYRVQRIDLRGGEVGCAQKRLRHFQFGSRQGKVLFLPRTVTAPETEPACMATEGQKTRRRSWERFCALQGLPEGFTLPAFTLAARYAAVGNGVPIPMARYLAAAIRDRQVHAAASQLCPCGCGRPVTGRQLAAGPACRKRLERQRKGIGSPSSHVVRDCSIATAARGVTVAAQSQSVTGPGSITAAASQERP